MRKMSVLILCLALAGAVLVPGVRAAAVTVNVNLNTTVLIAGKDSYVITGTVKKPSGSLITGVVDIDLLDAGNHLVTDGLVVNGKFELDIMDTSVLVPNSTLHIQLDPASLTALGLAAPSTPATIDYRYDLKQDTTQSLSYGDEDANITGRIVDADGVGVAGADVWCLGQHDTTRTNGIFLIVGDITTGGSIPIRVAPSDGCRDSTGRVVYMDYGAIAVKSLPLDQFTAVQQTIHDAFPVDLKLRVVADGSDVTRQTGTRYTLSGVKVYDDGFDSELGSEKSGDWYTKLVVLGSDLPSKFLLGGRGTLNITAEHDNGAYKGTTSVQVVDAANLNVMISGDISVAEVFEHGSATISAAVFDRDGQSPYRVSYRLSGAGITPVEVRDTRYRGSIGIGVSPNQGGELDLEVTGVRSDGSIIGTVTKEIEIVGWVATASTGELTVDTPTSVTVTVKTPSGSPVNNAVVSLANAVIKQNSTTTITSGRYTLNNVLARDVGDERYVVYDFDGVVQAFGSVLVKGNPVFTVALRGPKIVAGVPTDIFFTVRNEYGPIENLAELNSQPGVGVFLGGTKYSVVYDAATREYKAKVVVGALDRDTFVQVSLNEGREIGEARLEVLAPTVTVSPSPLTVGYQERVNISISDPVTKEPIAADVQFERRDLDSYLPNLQGKSQYQVDLTLIPEDTNNDGRTEPALSLDLVIGGLEVKTATKVGLGTAVIKADKTALLAGADNEVVLTLTNARGEVLAGYDIYRDRVRLARTDAAGQAKVTIRPESTGSIILNADTDVTGEYAETELKVSQDTTIPLINAALPLYYDGESLVVTGTATDDNGVAAIKVNDIAVAITPGKTVTFSQTISLQEGENTITIKATDLFDNTAAVVSKVTRRKTARTVAVAIGKVDAARGLDVAAYIASGRTMVPIRFVSESLGGTVSWDAVTDSTRIAFAGKTIYVTAGSKVATVNGTPVTLLVAPGNKSGRMFVGLTDMATLLGGTTSWDEATKTATVILP
jgi:hypothetical protein